MKRIWSAGLIVAMCTSGYAMVQPGGKDLKVKSMLSTPYFTTVMDTLPVTYEKDRQGTPIILPKATHTYPALQVNPVRPNNPPYMAPGNPSNPANSLYPNQQHNLAYPSAPATPLYPNNPTLPVTPVSPASPLSFPTSIPLAPVRP